MRPISLVVAIIAIAIASAGCGDDATGSVLVRYLVGEVTDSCRGDHGVFQIRVTLRSPEHEVEASPATCSDGGGEILVDNVPVDTYTVTVDALDPTEAVIRTDEETGVVVREGQTSETGLIRPATVPGSLNVTWRFENGFMCTQNNVEDIEIGWYLRGDYDSVLAPCMDGQAIVEDFASDSYNIRVRGIDAETGFYSFMYDEDGVNMMAGQVTSVVADLAECPTDCIP